MYPTEIQSETPTGTKAPTFKLVGSSAYASTQLQRVPRVYEATMVSEGALNGCRDLSGKKIRYFFEPCVAAINGVANHGAQNLVTADSLPTDWSRKEAANVMMKKVLGPLSDYAASFDQADFSGLAAWLGLCLGADSFDNNLSLALLARNQGLAATLMRQEQNAEVRVGKSVILPGNLSGYGTPVWHVLAACCAALGVGVLTDASGMALLRSALVCTRRELRRACWCALAILSHNACIDEAGCHVDLAFAVGWCRAVTLCGHTSEGALGRVWLRAVSFAPPHGLVVVPKYGTPLTTHWLVPVAGDQWMSAAMGDSVLVSLAACFCLADPGVQTQSGAVPVLLDADAADDAGRRAVHAAQLPTVLAGRAAQLCSAFYNVIGGSSYTVDPTVSLIAAANAADWANDAHLNAATIAPWYWVEPTSVVWAWGRGGVNDDAFNAPLAYVGGGASVHPLYAEVRTEGVFTIAAFRDMGARRNPWVVHRLHHARDGLACAYITEADDRMVVCSRQPDVDAAIRARTPISEYVWRHGDCQLPAPSEMIIADGRWEVAIHLVDEDGIPTASMLEGDERCKWSCRVSAPRMVVAEHAPGPEHLWDRADAARLARMNKLFEVYRRFDRPAVRIRHWHVLPDEAPDELVGLAPPEPAVDENVGAGPAAAEVVRPQPVLEELGGGGAQDPAPAQAQQGAQPQPAPAAPAEAARE